MATGRIISWTTHTCSMVNNRDRRHHAINKSASKVSTHHCMKKGQVLQDRWTIKGAVGQGGFGQIFKAQDNVVNEEVVVKAALRRRIKDTARMILETRVLLAARQHKLPNFPIVWGSGQDPEPVAKINFIVMQLLGDNLTDLRRKAPRGRLSIGCVMRMAHQAFTGFRDLHCTLGYLHRDVKPSNMAFGHDHDTRRTLYLIDFGLVRRFLDDDGNLKKERTPKVGYRGTARYSSVRVHQRYDQCRGDDLMSVWYSLLESLNGELPWKDKPETQLGQAKLEQQEEPLKYNFFTRYCPPELKEVEEEYIRPLEYADEPNYQTILDTIDAYLKKNNIQPTDPLDWENNYADCPK